MRIDLAPWERIYSNQAEWRRMKHQEGKNQGKEPSWDKEGRKLKGCQFGGLKPIPYNPSLDPLPKRCFRCWLKGHSHNRCPSNISVIYCYNCGRRYRTYNTCERCSDAHERYLKEKALRSVGIHRDEQSIPLISAPISQASRQVPVYTPSMSMPQRQQSNITHTITSGAFQRQVDNSTMQDQSREIRMQNQSREIRIQDQSREIRMKNQIREMQVQNQSGERSIQENQQGGVTEVPTNTSVKQPVSTTVQSATVTTQSARHVSGVASNQAGAAAAVPIPSVNQLSVEYLTWIQAEYGNQLFHQWSEQRQRQYECQIEQLRRQQALHSQRQQRRQSQGDVMQTPVNNPSGLYMNQPTSSVTGLSTPIASQNAGTALTHQPTTQRQREVQLQQPVDQRRQVAAQGLQQGQVSQGHAPTPPQNALAPQPNIAVQQQGEGSQVQFQQVLEMMRRAETYPADLKERFLRFAATQLPK